MQRIIFTTFLFFALFFTACAPLELPTKSLYVMDDYGDIFKLHYCNCERSRVVCYYLEKVDTTEIKIKTFDYLKKQ
jgi:hypothetical protein